MLDAVEKANEEKVVDKVRNAPASFIGLLGLTGIVGFSAYHYKKKPADMKTSLYM
jgi:hypothetical protein